jgi:tetratricopeptide (TPR) repeat protein
MKIKREVVIGLAVIFLFATVIVVLNIRRSLKGRSELAQRIAGLGNNGPPETIEGLQRAIAAYEARIEQHVKDAAQTGVYWKILAVRLQDKGLHNEALKALERALNYTPADQTLHYLTGVSAATIAKSYHNFEGRENTERDRLFALAEESYLHAIALDDRYVRPRYGIGVLYVFELDRPGDAIPHLERCLELSKNDVDAMFVLARAYYMTSAYNEAVAVYDRILSSTKDEQKRTEAQNNRQVVLGRLYG